VTFDPDKLLYCFVSEGCLMGDGTVQNLDLLSLFMQNLALASLVWLHQDLTIGCPGPLRLFGGWINHEIIKFSVLQRLSFNHRCWFVQHPHSIWTCSHWKIGVAKTIQCNAWDWLLLILGVFSGDILRQWIQAPSLRRCNFHDGRAKFIFGLRSKSLGFELCKFSHFHAAHS